MKKTRSKKSRDTVPLRFWHTSKRFGLVSILSSDIGTFVLSFLSVSGSGSTPPDPDPLVRGMDPDPDPSMRLLQKSEYTTSE